MTLEHLIDTYGYLAILLGTFFEGETVLILGGIAAKLGYLQLPWVIVYAFAGTLSGDQLFFFLGRHHGGLFLRARPSWEKPAQRVERILARHRLLIILGFRFLYGLRTVTPFVIGMSKVRFIEFLILNIIGAALWAGVIGTLGYAFGHSLEWVLGDIRRYEVGIMLLVLSVALAIWLVHIARRRRQ